MIRWLHLRLTPRLALAFVLFGAGLLAFVGVLAYSSGRSGLEAATITALTSVAMEKQVMLTDWVTDQQTHLSLIATSPDNREILSTLVHAPPGSAESRAAHDGLVNELQTAVGGAKPFLAMWVVDSETSQVIAATDLNMEGTYLEDRPYFINGKNSPYIQNPFYSLSLRRVTMVVSGPFRAVDGQLLAVLAAEVDLRKMNSIINQVTELGPTKDAFLVNTSNLFVTQPRFLPDPAVLQRGVHTEAVNRCLSGRSGNLVADDYRGISALIVYRWLSEREMCLIVKVDQDEAIASAQAFGRALVGISGLVLTFAALLAVVLARTLTRPIRTLQAGVTRLGQGELSTRLPENGHDELSVLAREFNRMAVNIAEKDSQLHDYADQLEQKVEERTAALRESERRFSQIFRSSPVAMGLSRLVDGQYVEVNDRMAALTGYPRDEIIGRTSEALNLFVTQPRSALVKEILSPGGMSDFEWQLRTKTGEIRNCSATTEVIELGGEKYIIAMNLDVTERQRAAEALRQSEERFRRAVADAPFPMLIHAENGEIIVVNETWTEITGYTHTDIPTIEAWTERAYGERQGQVQADIDRLYGLQGRQAEGEYIITTRGGQKRTWDFSSSPVGRLPDGRRLVLSMAMDVTERKHAEEREKHLAAVLRAIRNVNQLIVHEKDRDQLLQGACENLTNTRGYHTAWIALVDESSALLTLASSQLDANIPQLKQRLQRGEWVYCARQNLLQPGMLLIPDAATCGDCPLVHVGEERGRMSVRLEYEGRVFGVLVVSAPMEYTNDAEEHSLLEEIAGDLAFALHSIDLEHKRRQTESAKRESDARYRSLFENMLNGLAYCKMDFEQGRPQDFIYLDVNRAFETQTGLKNVVGRKVSEVIPGIRESDPEIFEVYGRVALTGQPERFENYVDSLGMWFFISVYSPAPEYFVAVFDVITKRKHAEAALRRYADRLAAVNRLDRIISTGLDIGQIYDRFVHELLALIPLDRTSIVLLNDSQDQWHIIRQWTRHNAILSVLDWHPTRGSALERVLVDRVSFLENEIGENEIFAETEALRREGLRSRMLIPLVIQDLVIGALTAASHEPAAFSDEDQAILTAIADQLVIAIQNARLYEQVQRHAAELEQRVAQRTTELVTANKELEAFSYSVSHDLRAPLRAMDGFSRILLEDYAAAVSEEVQEYLRLIREGAQQMGSLIDHLLDFSRLGRQPLRKQPVVVANLVYVVLGDLQTAREGRSIDILVGYLPDCQADPTLLRQVFANLLGNAVKFTKTRQHAVIEVGCREHAGETVYFVKDNGVGFDMQYANKLFGVFQRLHRVEEFEGTGVGLATVQRIIHRHGGRIWAEAEVDKGAAFYFTVGGEALNGNG